MTRFLDALGPIADRLDVPQPAKARILVELAGDMDDYYEHCRRGGRSEAEAHRETEARFLLSDETLAELAAVHTTGLRAFISGLSVAARTRAERVLFALLMVFVVAVAGVPLLQNDVLGQGSAPVAAAGLLALAAFAIGLWRGYALWIAQDHRLPQVRRGLFALSTLAASSVTLAVFAPLLEAQRIVGALAEPPDAPSPVAALLAQSAAAVALSFTMALLVAAVWYCLNRKVARIEQAELALLLET